MDSRDGRVSSISAIVCLYRLFVHSLRTNARSAEHSAMEKLLSELQAHTLSFAFLKPVNADEVPDYYDVIKEPMGKPLLRFVLVHNLTSDS